MLSLHHHQMLPGITINQQMLPGIASLALPLPDPSFPWNELNMVATSLTTTAAPKQQPGCWVLMPPFAASSMPPPKSALAPAAHTAGSQITWQPKAPAHGLASAHTFTSTHNRKIISHQQSLEVDRQQFVTVSGAYVTGSDFLPPSPAKEDRKRDDRVPTDHCCERAFTETQEKKIKIEK